MREVIFKNEVKKNVIILLYSLKGHCPTISKQTIFLQNIRKKRAKLIFSNNLAYKIR